VTDVERHARISALFAELHALPPSERAARLAQVHDADLRAAVEKLLAADAAAGSFLDEPATAGAPSAALLDVSAAPAKFGRYTILRHLGHGGMGDVYEAEQDSPRRRVALKLVRSSLSAPQVEKRLRQEAQIQSRLTHPGIVHVHEAGVVVVGGAPIPYIAMELVEGRDLLAHAHELSTRDRVRILADIASAVGHAHDRGVVHRDLKPANVLVDMEGRPRLLDFGIARALERRPEDGTLLTSTGQILGTLPYMSPEQLTRPGSVDRRADVYGLGALGFELISGRLPIDLRGLPLAEAARAVEEREPSLLTSIVPGADRELALILAKALEKDPARRYASAGELADDLQRWLRLEPVVARPASLGYVVLKLARRHRALVAAAITVFVVLALATLVSTREAMRARRAQRGAEESGARAKSMAYAAGIAAASANLAARDASAAERRLAATPPELRGWEWRHLFSRLDASDLHRPLPDGWLAGEIRVGKDFVDVLAFREETGPRSVLRWDRAADRWRDPVEAIASSAPRAWLPEFHFIHRLEPGEGAYATRDPVTGEPGTEITPCLVVPVESEVIALSADGQLLMQISGDTGGPLTCNQATGRMVRGLWPNRVREASDSPATPLIALAWDGSRDRVRLLDAATFAPRLELEATSGVVDVDLDVLRGRAIGVLGSGRVMAWNLADGAVLTSAATERTSGSGRLEMAPETSALAAGRGLVALTSAENVELWQGDLAERLDVLVGHRQHVVDLAFSSDARELTSLGDDGFRSWSLPRSDPWSLAGHGTFVYEVEFDATGSILFSGGWDGAVRAWSVRSGRELGALRIPGVPDAHVPQVLVPTTDGKRLLVGLRDGHVGLLSLESGEWLASRVDALREPGSGGVLDDGSLVFACGSTSPPDNGVSVLDSMTLRETRRFEGLLPPACALPGGRVAGWLDDGRIAIVHAADGSPIAHCAPEVGGAMAMAASPDGTRLVTAAAGRPLAIWDAATGARLASGDLVPPTQLLCVAWSAADRIAVGTREGALRIYDATTASELLALRPHAAYVYALAWSPDGETLASASGDGTVRLHGTRSLSDALAARAEEEAAEADVAARFAALTTSALPSDAALAATFATDRERAAARRLRLRIVLEHASGTMEPKAATTASGG